jgi:hypothetical protein
MGDEAYQSMLEGLTRLLPLQKVATADEMAEALVWFLESATNVTGTTLIVDGGLHLGKLPPSSSDYQAKWTDL